MTLVEQKQWYLEKCPNYSIFEIDLVIQLEVYVKLLNGVKNSYKPDIDLSPILNYINSINIDNLNVDIITYLNYVKGATVGTLTIIEGNIEGVNISVNTNINTNTSIVTINNITDIDYMTNITKTLELLENSKDWVTFLESIKKYQAEYLIFDNLPEELTQYKDSFHLLIGYYHAFIVFSNNTKPNQIFKFRIN